LKGLPRGTAAGASLTEEEKARIEWLYLTPNKPAAASVIENIKQYGIELNPSAVYRYVKRIPKAIKDLYRNGKKYFHDKNEACLERDYTLLKSMDAVCGDYMTGDILCRAGAKPARAKLCAFTDMRSRVIAGWSLQLTANSVGVARALRMRVREYGTPKAVYADNGKEFKNCRLCGGTWKAAYTKTGPKTPGLEAGILHECGIAVHFTAPYCGQSKPVERFRRTFHEKFDKFCPSYAGSNTSGRPEETREYRSAISRMKDGDIVKIPAFKDLEKSIAGFMYWYNTGHHHSGSGMGGKTPMEVMKENAAPRREIPAGYGRYVFTERGIKTVQRDGVNLDGIWYYNPKFIAITGQKVQVRRSIGSIDTVSIFSLPDVVYLYDAEGNLLKETGAAAEDIRRVKKPRREAAAIKPEYNKKKAGSGRRGFKTPAELLAERAGMPPVIEDAREAAGGEPLAAIKRRLRLPAGPD
jgi:hypothetical protein